MKGGSLRGLLPRAYRAGAGKGGLISLVLMLVLAAVGLCACSGLPLDHSQDVTDIQGEWQVSGTMMTIVITSNQIRMSGDTNYDYTIDVNGQTMTFSVGSVSGTAGYTLTTDKKTGTQTLSLTETDGGSEKTTELVKLSDDTTVTPSVDGGASAFAVSSEETA